jgi:hypothetical protein
MPLRQILPKEAHATCAYSIDVLMTICHSLLGLRRLKDASSPAARAESTFILTVTVVRSIDAKVMKQPRRSLSSLACAVFASFLMSGCSSVPAYSSRGRPVLAVVDGMTASGAHVSYNGEYVEVVRVRGAMAAQVVVVPWSDNLTVAQAIATAGGYNTPPVRSGSILRGDEVVQLDPGHLEHPGSPILRPDDMIELK